MLKLYDSSAQVFAEADFFFFHKEGGFVVTGAAVTAFFNLSPAAISVTNGDIAAADKWHLVLVESFGEYPSAKQTCILADTISLRAGCLKEPPL
jgi:hypothetical protein